MIRKATLQDMVYINPLGETLHEHFAQLFHLETEIDSAYGIVLVSEENEVINGFLYALDTIDNIDLLSIVVSLENRKKGIGRALLNELIHKYAINKTITLEVDKDNIAAINLYKKYGFNIENVRKGYYNGNDAYLMKRGIK